MPSLPPNTGLGWVLIWQLLGHQCHLPGGDFTQSQEAEALPTDFGLKGGMKTELCAVVQDVISKARWGWIASTVGVSVINTFQTALGCRLCQIQEFPCEYWGKQEPEESPCSLIPLICSSEARRRDAAVGTVGNRWTQSPNPGRQSLPCFSRVAFHAL